MSVTCIAESRSLITTTWSQKGRKKMLLRQTENYGLPNLLENKINKELLLRASMLACVTVCVFSIYFFTLWGLQADHDGLYKTTSHRKLRKS